MVKSRSKKNKFINTTNNTTTNKPKPKGTNRKPLATIQNTNDTKTRATKNAERSSYFARREAAKVLRNVLQGDAKQRAVASIKSIIYGPSVRNKKATFALVCQTLKHLSILKDVLEIANVLNSKWKRQEELMYVITYDILFGQAILLVGAAEKFLLLRKDSLQSALLELCGRRKVESVEDLLLLNHKTPEISKPRYVRVNNLKLDLDSAFHEFGRENMVNKDDLVPDLLVLPPGTDLHDHPLVMDGSVFLQGKASSMVAVALGSEPGWEVLDACSAPGNKTVHLAALMKGKGKILACELNKDRVKRLEETIKCSGASNVQVLHCDFLSISTEDPLYSKVRAILLDPSCSGSGTAADRLDHLLPSYAAAQTADLAETQRIKNLAAFQSKALAHALSFPAVERVVYSTCSIYQTENEDVVKSVLPLAASLNFQLETPFPQWPRRGLPVFEGAQHLLRTDPAEDMEGFFIALFVKKKNNDHATKKPILFEDTQPDALTTAEGSRRRSIKGTMLYPNQKITRRRRAVLPIHFSRLSHMLLFARSIYQRKTKNMKCKLKSNGDCSHCGC